MLFFATALFAQQRHVVMMENGAFNPATITIMENDVVVWKNASTAIHTSTSGTNCTNNGTWNSGDVAPGDSFVSPAGSFATADNYDYFCIPHCGSGMVGVVIVQSSTGVAEKEREIDFTLYPNPSENTLFVNLGTASAAKVAVRILDITGKSMIVNENILQPGQDNLKVDISSLSKGSYIIQLSTEEGIKSEVFYKL